MHNDLVELGWSDSQWNRIVSTVCEEAQKARVVAQMLPLVGPEDPTTVAVPTYALDTEPHGAVQRLSVDSDPTLFLTTIWVNVFLHLREAADPQLSAALTMFRRASNYIARIEDALLFHGRPFNKPPTNGISGIPLVYGVSGHGEPRGLLVPKSAQSNIHIASEPSAGAGDRVVTAIIEAINELDAKGQLGPYACALSPELFKAVCSPNANLVLPRDRILPFLQGPLLRASALATSKTSGDAAAEAKGTKEWGLVVALSGNPIELIVASDLSVRYLQTSEEPRLVFRVAERVALRIKEPHAVVSLSFGPKS